MRLIVLLVTAILTGGPAWAQGENRPVPASGQKDGQAAQKATTADSNQAQDKSATGNLPVSIEKIRLALAQPVATLKGLDETPTFRVEIRERQKLDDLIKSLDFKSGPAVPGGLYGYEQQRQLFPSVDNPLAQPYAAFNQGELLTVLIENLVGRYLAGRALSSITSAERAHAEAVAKEEVTQAVAQYCAHQPNGGAGIQICTSSPR